MRILNLFCIREHTLQTNCEMIEKFTITVFVWNLNGMEGTENKEEEKRIRSQQQEQIKNCYAKRWFLLLPQQ